MAVLSFGLFYATVSFRDDSLGYVRRSLFHIVMAPSPTCSTVSPRVNQLAQLCIAQGNNPIFTYFYYHTTPILNSRLLCMLNFQMAFLWMTSHIVRFDFLTASTIVYTVQLGF